MDEDAERGKQGEEIVTTGITNYRRYEGENDRVVQYYWDVEAKYEQHKQSTAQLTKNVQQLQLHIPINDVC